MSPHPTVSPTSSPTHAPSFNVSSQIISHVITCSDLSPDALFCAEFLDGDYTQIFSIALFILLINLGLFLLHHSSYAQLPVAFYRTPMSELIASWQGITHLMDSIQDEKFRNLEANRVSGMPVSSYVFFDTIIKILYFIIKIILFTNTFDNNGDNAFDYVNELFNHGFNQFVTAQTIILTTILFHTVSSTYQTTKYYCTQRGGMSNVCNCFMVLCILLLWIDFIASVVLICVRYGLLVYILYSFAVAIVVALILLCTICCSLPIILLLVTGIMVVFNKCVCGQTNTPLGKFMLGIGGGLSAFIVLYLIICVMLVFQFIFLGGPSQSIIYIMKDDKSEIIALGIFAIATALGLFSVIFAFLYSCRDSATPQRQRLATI